MKTTLDKLRPGQSATVLSVGGPNASVSQRLMEMGLFEGTEVSVVRFAPMGDPMELNVCGYNLSVRKIDAAGVSVELPGSPS